MNDNILITGGCRGIGLALTERFLRAGQNVTATYNTSAETAKKLTQNHPNFTALKLNFFDNPDLTELINGDFDILINNAGIAEQKLFTDITDTDFDRMFDLNIKSVFRVTRAVTPEMIRKKRGVIINIASIWGLSGASLESHYSASKAAVIGLTKSLAKELAPSGIRVNCIAPGVILTDMCRDFDENTKKSLIEATPLGRFGTASDIAEAAFFLASESANFITGQVLTVDGGFLGL
jgi:3-oxoacyl-[acyl-carrier protein] reductase